MAIGSGIGSQLGIVAETTFNTPVTVTRFYEFTSENLQYNKKTAVGMGLRAGGLLPRSQRRVVTTTDASGDIALDLPSRGLGLLLAQAMGTSPSPTTITTGVYSYAFTLGDVYGRSFTAQVGVPQYGGTVTPKTLGGCKVSSFELAVSNAAIATGKFNIDAASLTTGISLATASFSNYATTNLFNFSQGAITVDGSSVANVKDFTLTVDNTLKTDRFNLGAAGIKAEQTINGFRKISGKLTAEFTDTTLLAKYLSDANTALVLTFTGGVIALAQSEKLVINVSAVKFNADTPNVAGPGVIDLAMSFEAYDDGTNQPLTITYQTADAAL
jgi:Phage tail tube protein